MSFQGDKGVDAGILRRAYKRRDGLRHPAHRDMLDAIERLIAVRPKPGKFVYQMRKIARRGDWPTKGQLDTLNRFLEDCGLRRLAMPVRTKNGREAAIARHMTEQKRDAANLDAICAKRPLKPPKKGSQ